MKNGNTLEIRAAVRGLVEKSKLGSTYTNKSSKDGSKRYLCFMLLLPKSKVDRVVEELRKMFTNTVYATEAFKCYPGAKDIWYIRCESFI